MRSHPNRSITRIASTLFATLGAVSLLTLGSAHATDLPFDPAVPDTPSEPISVEFVTSIVGAPAGTPLSGPALEEETNRVSHGLRCPVCQGSSVGDSPSQSARNMKDEVRDLLAAGFTADQVVAYFEFSYGEFVRLEPKAEGFNLVVWLAPLLLLFGGAAITVVAIRRFSAQAPATAAVTGIESSDDDDGLGENDPAIEDPVDVDPELDPYLDRVRSLAYGGENGSAPHATSGGLNSDEKKDG